MKIPPISKDIKPIINKTIKSNKNTAERIKPVKNYSDYLKEYGLK